MSPSDRVVQVYPLPPTTGSILVAFYYSQGYGGNIPTRLLTRVVIIYRGEIGYEVVSRIETNRDGVQWLAFVNMVMNLGVPEK
jgi:hypothetical protein